MNQSEKYKLLRSLTWDYNIPVEDLEKVLSGTKERAGHYDRDLLFIKILETFPWFTIIQLYPINDIEKLLTDDVINRLRMPSLRKKYEFVKKRLQQVISATR